jgi:hypothetical protein
MEESRLKDECIRKTVRMAHPTDVHTLRLLMLEQRLDQINNIG